MKRIFAGLLLSVIYLTSCSKGGSMPSSEADATVQRLRQVLSGPFVGTYRIMNTENIWYTERIVFSPYNETKEIIPIFEHKFHAYGTAEIEDSRFMAISGVQHCYYTIGVKYEGAVPTVSFYEYDPKTGNVINREDRRNIIPVDEHSFEM